MNDFRMDSHKLMYHPGRVTEWLQGKDIYPLYIEIAPVYGCNHQCSFCAFDYLGKKPHFLRQEVISREFPRLFKKGVRSVLFAGEGEPLVHPQITVMINDARKAGLDAALATNGVLFDQRKSGLCLSSLTWLRFSINAATKRTYARIHRCSPDDFDTVLDNIRNALRLRNKIKARTTIGVQCVLLQENYDEVLGVIKLFKGVGIDYVVIKPYSRHPLSKHHMLPVSFNRAGNLYEKAKQMENENFKVIFRLNAMRKIEEPKKYKRCLGLPFWSYIDASGDVYACSSFLGRKDFCYGNIYALGFSGVWESRKRKRMTRVLTAGLNVGNCRKGCRMDEVNAYLWEIKHPSKHVNFI